MATLHNFPKSLLERFSYLKERPSADCFAFNVPADQLQSLCTTLRDEYGYSMCMDVTAADWDVQSPRFTSFYHLFNPVTRVYLRLAADCLNDASPTAPSISKIWPAANWHEREAYDMFGIRFEGHPDLKRILMWDTYAYYPLRKDFPLAGIETDLPAADVAEETKAKVIAAPQMGGPFYAEEEGAPMSHEEPQGRDESWSEEKPKPGQSS